MTSFLREIINAEAPRQSVEDLALFIEDAEEQVGRENARGANAWQFIAEGHREIWRALHALCLASGQDEAAPWPTHAVDAWLRLRRILRDLAHMPISSNGNRLLIGDRWAKDSEIEAMFARHESSEFEANGGAAQTHVVHAAIGLLVYARRRVELSGNRCLAHDEALSLALWIVLWYHDNRPDEADNSMNSLGLLTATNRARARAEEDHREGLPGPFAMLEAWESDKGDA